MWSLAWPWALLALPLPWLARRLLPEARDQSEAGLRVPSLAGFETLRDRGAAEKMLNWRFWVAVLAWCLLVLAAARPERIGDELEVPVAGRNLMLAVDLSGSMDQKDFELAGRKVDRLTATKAVASDFISRREGDRIGLILFGERAYLQVPLTLDRETVKILLMEAFIGLAGEKTAIGDAITLAVKRIHDQSADASEQVLILLTDGNDTSSKMTPINAADIASLNGVEIYPIGIGNTEATGEDRVDFDTLAAIARRTGGEFFNAEEEAGLGAVYRRIDETAVADVRTQSWRPRESLVHWPAGIAVVLVLFAYILLLTGSRRQGASQ